MQLIVFCITDSSKSSLLYSLFIKSNNICLNISEERDIISLIISCSFDNSLFIPFNDILYLFIIELNEFIVF